MPASGHAERVILFVHGGAFVEGRRGDLTIHNPDLLRQVERDIAVMTIDYRLEPFPAAVFDLDAAVRFVRSDAAADLGLDARQVVVAGHSAGGTIAAVFALGADAGAEFASLERVDGWIGIGTPVDLGDHAPAGSSLRRNWQAGDNPLASPVNLVSAGDPRGLVVHGDSDPVIDVWHALRFADVAAAVSPALAQLEIVSSGASNCRGHTPMCGASPSGLDSFLDSLPQQSSLS